MKLFKSSIIKPGKVIVKEDGIDITEFELDNGLYIRDIAWWAVNTIQKKTGYNFLFISGIIGFGIGMAFIGTLWVLVGGGYAIK